MNTCHAPASITERYPSPAIGGYAAVRVDGRLDGHSYEPPQTCMRCASGRDRNPNPRIKRSRPVPVVCRPVRALTPAQAALLRGARAAGPPHDQPSNPSESSGGQATPASSWSSVRRSPRPDPCRQGRHHRRLQNHAGHRTRRRRHPIPPPHHHPSHPQHQCFRPRKVTQVV
jgi:hypothetical protein